MGALSEVLSTLRVRGSVSSCFEGCGAWAFGFPAYERTRMAARRAASIERVERLFASAVTIRAQSREPTDS
jgi:hypothetical protein